MRKKMKKMTLSELEDTFQIVDKQEQTLYIGGRQYRLYNDGRVEFIQGTENEDRALVSECGNTISLPPRVGGILRHNSQGLNNINSIIPLSKYDGKEIFNFVAHYSNVEWAMAIKKCGAALLWTDQRYDRVGMIANPNIKYMVHSHPTYDFYSCGDRIFAGINPGMTHVLWHNGQFRNFNGAGWTDENWRDRLF